MKKTILEIMCYVMEFVTIVSFSLVLMLATTTAVYADIGINKYLALMASDNESDIKEAL